MEKNSHPRPRVMSMKKMLNWLGKHEIIAGFLVLFLLGITLIFSVMINVLMNFPMYGK